MKSFFIFYLSLFLSQYSTTLSINNDSEIKSVNKINNTLLFSKKNYNMNDQKRLLSDNDDSFHAIRIFIDKKYIISQNIVSGTVFNKVMGAIEKCINITQKLLKVNNIEKIKFSDSDLVKLGLNLGQYDDNLLSSGQGIDADLIIIPKFIEGNSIIALGEPIVFDQSTKRPIGGILSINKNLPTIENSVNYLESIILHQFTHILGFLDSVFNNFPGGKSKVIKIENETRTNPQNNSPKNFIITPKVVSYAKKYFNCSNITGVELEKEGGYDEYEDSHWEARILLGEYMNSETHTPEQAISGFTLALLEDSGWYRVNNYTGGLMRYGKNQGCDFLYKDCEVLDDSNNKHKNDFFTQNNYFGPTCTSGRQSRSYSYREDGISRGLQFRGKKIADYCFVSDLYKNEEEKMFYVGSCNKGGGEYGQRIIYNSQTTSKNGDIPYIFGEKISSNSFCILSSAIPTLSKNNDITQYNYYLGITHPMCYPMFCSEKSLTIQVYDQYIVCPREGGIVEITGEFLGHIYCPDFNLICTGTVMCNDMFECVEKESLEKIDTFDYDYEIKTSQVIIAENELGASDISIGYELSGKNDGKCPEHCSQCKENKKCFICENDYLLIGTRENDENPIICSQNKNLSNYYKNENDNTFYLCEDNCLKCNSKNECNVCDPRYRLNLDNSNCEEKIPNCKIYDINYENCEECKEKYYLLDDDKNHCHNETIEQDNYFTEDDGKTFISCDKAIVNCIKCENRNYCSKCEDGYIFKEENILCDLKIHHCKTFDNNYEECEECDEGYYLLSKNKTKCHDESIDNEKYFTEDEGKSYTSCSDAIEKCLKCENRNVCTLCADGYIFEEDKTQCTLKIPHCKIFDVNYEYCVECESGYYIMNENKSQCHNETINNDIYFTEDGGKSYTKCENIIENCIKCDNKNYCDLCKEGYIFDNEVKQCNLKIPHCNKFDINFEYCEECDEGFYLLYENKTKCHDQPIDTEKYFTEDDGKSYIKCENVIENCIKCQGRQSCTECLKTYIIGEEGDCEPKIPYCKIFDSNFENCMECEKDYYLLNNDSNHCYNSPLNDSFFTEDDGKSYISCDKAIESCFKCQGRESCTECNENYYLLDNDFSHCSNIKINDSFFTEDNGKSYISCEKVIDNCNKCKERNYCLGCKEGYIVDKDNSLCTIICDIKINTINDKDINFLQEENIYTLIQNYIENNDKKAGLVEHYVNTIYNYSITIFKHSECTKNLLNISSYYLNTKNITAIYDKEILINCFITYNSKNFINFYQNNGEKIFMENDCPQCLDLKYNIINNYTNEFSYYYGAQLLDKLMKEKSFSNESNILNNTCNSLDYAGINIPIKIENINFEAFFCTDQFCLINKNDLDNNIADCDCKINYEMNYLLNDISEYSNKESSKQFLSFYKINSLEVFSCFFNNIKNAFKNFAFYFSITCESIEIVSFIFYLLVKQQINLQKYSIENNTNINSKEDKSNNIENNKKENNIIPTEENNVSSLEKFTNNPPPRKSILYKYRWLKNKPRVLSLENSHDEDLEIQSRDEGDPENEIMRKIKNISFFDKNSNDGSSYLEDSLSDRDRVTETSKNKITLIPDEKTKKITDKVEERKDNDERKATNFQDKKTIDVPQISPKKEDRFQTLNINKLPQILTREENARRKKKTHSIKNARPTDESKYDNKVIEKKPIKSPLKIYLEIICIKQHIINLFPCLYNHILGAESFIPFPMKIIRLIFMIIINMFFNIILIKDNYFIEKYNYFNAKYGIENSGDKNIIISNGSIINYALKNTFSNAFISFILCLIIQLIVGFLFFRTKKKIDNVIEISDKTTQKQELNKVMSGIKLLFIIFFVVNFILVLLSSIYNTGFNMIYNKSVSDFIIPTVITFIMLQIFPFIISIIITLLIYYGLKKENKKLINAVKNFLF